MRAALITGVGQLELREFPDPEPSPNGAVVDIAFCGVCGTDLHAFQSGAPYNPAICGHEWTGTVTSIGREVSRFSEGDRVVVGVPPACGSCDPCQAGQASYCSTSFLVALGRDPLAPPHGGFAPRIAVGTNRLLPANAALDDETLAQVEPAAVAFHAVRRSGIRLGDTAVIQGAGPIGLLTLQLVRASGAGEIIVVEPNERRQNLARELGANVTVTPAEAEAVTQDRTTGLGADVVYECVGRPETVQDAVDLVRRGGSVCLIGLSDGDAPITPRTWLIKEVSVTSAIAYVHEDFEMAMGMMADGRVRVGPLHTSTVGLDGLADALSDLGSGSSEHIKVLVDPHA
ncbi:MAG: zinc-binding dehydrogenase [Actinomycetota bacterium]|nr:zinc-binding dehydrogenase [Actinomycetota bacterium]